VRPPLAYHRPGTVEEACRLLAAEPRAAVLAGGTDLMVHLRQPWRGRRPPAVVSIRRIPELGRIEVTERAVRLGAAVTLGALMEDPTVGAEYPVLPLAARYMGSPAIRNLATVGGNLCNASPAADLPPVLLVLDARAGIAGPGGARTLPLAEFFRGPGQTALGPGELLVWVEWPRAGAGRAGWATGYERLDVRRAMDIAIAAAALAVRAEGGRVVEARVALGAVAPTPLRVPAAEAALRAAGLTDAGIAAAAAEAAAACRPIDDVRAGADYRREMVAVLVRRGLARLAGRAA
jgi:carbon-monoxide dehydrogenase medium subunit